MAHPFDPGYTGMSGECNALVLRDDAGDDCGLPRDHQVHESVGNPDSHEWLGMDR